MPQEILQAPAIARLDKPALCFNCRISLIFFMVNRSCANVYLLVLLGSSMPYFGLTSDFLSSPLFEKCAPYSGLTVRHVPAYAICIAEKHQLTYNMIKERIIQ